MKKSQSIKSILALTLLTAIGTVSSTASAKTITAFASGDQYPDMRTAPGSVANGDFFITDKGSARNIGDGNNEVTHWELDFRNNFGGNVSDMRTFLRSKKLLCSAILSLKMHPGKSNGMKGDVIGIVGQRAIGKNLPFRQNWADTSMTQNIQFDLLDSYSAEDINDSLISYPLGAVQMRYYDDALISGASLMLNYSDTDTCTEELQAIEELQMSYDFNAIIKGLFVPGDQFIPGDEFIPGDQFLPGDEFIPGDQFIPGDEFIPGDQFIPGDEFIPGDQFIPGDEFIPGDQFIPGDEFIPGDQFIPGDEFIPGDQFIPGDEFIPGDQFIPGDEFIPGDQF